ncbi:copper-binding protein [Actinoplanes sp. NPDC051470]|uniref:OmpL47-type beta-barrel domain-containing protein n=1 Tax=unclassified Actinoplanes TaxID=2626549 RepID=UPI0034222B34
MNLKIRAAFAALVLLVSTFVVAGASPAAAAVQTLNWTADSDITRYKSAPSSAVAGATTIVWENSEATGNNIGMPHTLTFDTSAEGYNHDVNVNQLASPFDQNNGRWVIDVVLTPGKYRYFCSIPGHSTMVGEFTVTGGPVEDTTPPTVTGSVAGNRNDDGDYVGSATVTVNATDSGSGVDTVEYQVDDTSFLPYTAPVVVDELGDHSVQFRATDKAGNTSAVGSVSFTVVEPGDEDVTPPSASHTIAGDKDANGNYIGTATVTVTATDADSGVALIEYNVDGGAYQPYTAPVVVNTPGSHMVHYRATDNAGNRSAEQMAMFTVVARPTPDTTPPATNATVAGSRDTNGNYIGTATVTVTATDADSGVATVEYQLDSGAWTAYTAPVAVTAVGAHTLRYRATDQAGNAAPEKSVTFTVVAPPQPDTTAPATTASAAGEQDGDGNFVGAATVTVTATDSESGVARIQYALDAGGWTTYTAPVVVRTAGAHTLKYRATDNAGNTAPEKSVTFTVVTSGEDACPASDTRPTVIIGTDDTRVPNRDTGDGCTVNDLVAEFAPYPNHAAFVRHVETVTGPLVPGTLTPRQQGAIVRAAARSTVGS